MRTALFASLVVMAGCEMGPSGYSAPYKAMNPNPVSVSMAADAPSIS